MKYSSSDKKKHALKENKINPKLGFTTAVIPYNFVDFDTDSSASSFEPISKSISGKTSSSKITATTIEVTPRKAIKNIPDFKKSSFITQCPPGYSPIGGLNVGSQFLNCVHDITRKQIQIICPPNHSLDASGKCTLNKNNQPHKAPKNAKSSNFEPNEYEEEYDFPKIYMDFPKNAHDSFRSSKKIIISDEK